MSSYLNDPQFSYTAEFLAFLWSEFLHGDKSNPHSFCNLITLGLYTFRDWLEDSRRMFPRVEGFDFGWCLTVTYP